MEKQNKRKLITLLLLVLFIKVGQSGNNEKWDSVGCYKADSWEVFMRHIVPVEGKITVAGCAKACHKRHYGLFGLRDAVKCRCDNALKKATKELDDKCETPCVEDTSKKCGVGKFVYVYQYRQEGEFKWTGWSDWSACSVTCGSNGQQERTRVCMKTLDDQEEPTEAIYCPGRNDTDSQSCSATTPCTVLQWSDWSAWSACSQTCGPNGKQNRTRQCQKVTGSEKGTASSSECPGQKDAEDQSCNTAPCPVYKCKAQKQIKTQKCQKISGGKLKNDDSTNSTGVRRCSITATNFKSKGYCKANDKCGGKACIGRAQCLQRSGPKLKDGKRVCHA